MIMGSIDSIIETPKIKSTIGVIGLLKGSVGW